MPFISLLQDPFLCVLSDLPAEVQMRIIEAFATRRNFTSSFCSSVALKKKKKVKKKSGEVQKKYDQLGHTVKHQNLFSEELMGSLLVVIFKHKLEKRQSQILQWQLTLSQGHCAPESHSSTPFPDFPAVFLLLNQDAQPRNMIQFVITGCLDHLLVLMHIGQLISFLVLPSIPLTLLEY